MEVPKLRVKGRANTDSASNSISITLTQTLELKDVLQPKPYLGKGKSILSFDLNQRKRFISPVTYNTDYVPLYRLRNIYIKKNYVRTYTIFLL